MEELPNELLLQIFSYLHTPPITCFSSPHVADRSPDLVVLLRVCRRLRDAAAPLVYESIERAGDTNSPAYLQLPYALLNNIELCRYIKNVRLKMEYGFEAGDFWAGHSLSSEHESGDEERVYYNERNCRYQRRRPCDAQESDGKGGDEEVNKLPVNTPERYKWLAKLVSTMDNDQANANNHDLLQRAILGEDVLLTPCVLSAPNLERLWIRLPALQLDGSHTSFLLNSLSYSAHTGGFEKLKVLHLDVYESGLEWSVSHVLAFFHLPNLVDLTLGNCGSTHIGDNYNESIKPDENDAAFMVTEFEVVLPYEDVPYNSTFYEDVSIGLIEHANTLVKLSFGNQLSAYDCSLLGGFGTFRIGSQLALLKFLRINPYTLFGSNSVGWYKVHTSSVLSDALPHTIEHFWIDLAYSPFALDLIPYFRGLFEAHQNGRFPHLKSIHVYWYKKIHWEFSRITRYLTTLLFIRHEMPRHATFSFDISVRADCNTSEFADNGLKELIAIKRYFTVFPLVHCRRYDVDHKDGRRYYVEGSTCETSSRTPEEIQDDLDHGYWASSISA
ncbi:hypothetical protein G6011_10117 [Alternaria panax]|uniref:F-box domain-containing protein n=1 Tax=Alternaria panax TaxID=48097 RepID=A0AAD4FG99_9PLEO|nr:hypothetical protein G6011_10117 [Alternaria panax]